MKLNGTMKINELGHLEIGGCDTVKLAEEFGTPLYVIDEAYLRETCRKYQHFFKEHFERVEVLYAGKAMLTVAIAAIMNEEQMGLDVVSGGELYTALKAGFPSKKIYLHGNNKSEEEIQLALEEGVGRIVVDNFYELQLLETMCSRLQKNVSILLRITPGIEAHTHEYIRTGQIDSKFGFTLPNGQAIKAVREALKLKNVNLEGLHCHIGSQIFEPEPFASAARIMLRFMDDLRRETGKELRELNLGGGFGIYYASGDTPAETQDFAEAISFAIKDESRKLNFPIPKIIIEPGRSVVGPAGTTLYKIGHVKEIPGVRRYLAVDGGMTDNIRPALYQARYEAVIANKVAEKDSKVYSVTGKCCESGDMLIWDIKLPEAAHGDILAVFCTGAYGYSMSNNYNRIPRPAAVLVCGGNADLIVKRETLEDIVRNDLLPKRLQRVDMAAVSRC